MSEGPSDSRAPSFPIHYAVASRAHSPGLMGGGGGAGFWLQDSSAKVKLGLTVVQKQRGRCGLGSNYRAKTEHCANIENYEMRSSRLLSNPE